MAEEIKWLAWEDGEEWGEIACPMLDNENIMTYCPKDVPCYYTYTAPFVEDGEVCYYRFDQDEGCWDEDVLFSIGEYTEGVVVKFG